MQQKSIHTFAGAITKRLGVLGNPNRVKILLLCAKKPLTVSELATSLGISMSRVSNNLAILEHAGLITRTKQKDNTVLVQSLITITSELEVLNK